MLSRARIWKICRTWTIILTLEAFCFSNYANSVTAEGSIGKYAHLLSNLFYFLNGSDIHYLLTIDFPKLTISFLCNNIFLPLLRESIIQF